MDGVGDCDLASRPSTQEIYWALRLHPQFLLVTVGAMMFTASDMILARQLFTRPEGAPPQLVSSLLVWGLYFFGQALIAWGLIHPLV